MSAKSIELNKEKGSVVVEYEFSGEKWTNIFNKTKTNKIKKLKVDGFRPGKAPKHIVDKYVTPVAVASDSINEAYNVFADEIFEEVKKQHENVLQNAVLLELPVLAEESSVIKIEFPLLPDLSNIKLDKSIKTKVSKLKVTEADIDEYLNQLLSKNALVLPLDKKDKTKLGDVVTLKYKGFVNNEPFDGGEADSFDLKLGSKTFIDTFEDQLVGKTVGWKGEVNVTFPENYAVPTLKGQPAVFECEILDAKRLEEIKPTDENVKELHLPNVSNLEEAKSYAKEILTVKKYSEIHRQVIDSLVDELVEKHQFAVSDILVTQGAQKRLEEIKANLKQQGIKFNEYLDLIKTSEADFNKLVLSEEKVLTKRLLVHEELMKQFKDKAEISEDNKHLWAINVAFGQQFVPLPFVLQYMKQNPLSDEEGKENQFTEAVKEVAVTRLILAHLDKKVADHNDKVALELAKKLIEQAEKDVQQYEEKAKQIYEEELAEEEAKKAESKKEEK